VVKEGRGVSTLALAAEQNGRGLLTQPPPVRARDVLYNSSSSRNAGRIHLWRGCTYYPRVRRGLSFRIITRTRAAPGHTVRATVATRPNERARPRRGGDPINLRKRKKALLTNARRAAAEMGSHDALSASPCIAPATAPLQPCTHRLSFSTRQGHRPAGPWIGSPRFLTELLWLGIGRTRRPPVRTERSTQEGRKERIGGGRRSVSPRPGRGPREKFPSVWSFPSFLVV
jgi:hypothetical protein